MLFIILPFFGVTLILTIAANALLFLFTKSYRKTDWLLTMAKITNGHTVVVGYAHLGQKVVRELLKLEQEVVVIEKDGEKEEILRLIDNGTVPVVIGNARYPEILMKANISQARAMILTSKHEGHNLEVAIKAKKINKNLKIVMRLFELDIGKLTETIGISTAFSTSTLSAPVFAMASIMPEIKDAIVIRDNIFYFVELIVHEKSSFSEHVLEELENECDVNVITLKHNDDLMIRPDTDSTIVSPGNTILMLGDLESVKKAKQLIQSSTIK
jgi:voltage-gated potassium channel